MDFQPATDQPKRTILVLIAEDHSMTARLMSQIINNSSNCFAIGIAKDGREIIDLAKINMPDIITMDINMPYLDGISAMEEILKFNKDIKFIMISSYDEEWVIRQSILKGANGFIAKNFRSECLLNAIQTVFSGGTYLDERCLQYMVDRDISRMN